MGQMGQEKSNTDHGQDAVHGRWGARAGERLRNWASRFKARYHLNLPDGIAILFSLALSFWLRITGFDWGGIRSTYQTDEKNLVPVVIEMARAGRLSSDDFYYPNQFLSKFQAIVLMVFQKITGRVSNYSMLEPYWICRVITILAGILTICICFLIGNYFQKHLGAIFASLVAASPYMTLMAKQVTGDVGVAFASSLALLFALRYSEGRKKRYLCLMSMGAAMATMEKWHGGFLTVFIAVTVAIYAPSIVSFIWHGLFALFSYFAWIFLIAPSVILHFRTAIVDGFLNIAVYENVESPGYFSNASFYMQESILRSGGIVYILAAIFGFFLIVLSKNKQYSILLAGAIKVAILSLLNRHFGRWNLEMILCELFLISVFVQYLWDRGGAKLHGLAKGIKRAKWQNLGKIAISVVYVLLFLDGLSGCLLIDLVAVRKGQDVRYVQDQYCQSHAITPTNAISALYSAFAPGGIRTDIEGYARITSNAQVFLLQDGELYRLWGKKCYIWTSRCENDEIKKYLDAHCPVIQRFDRAYNDIFGDPLESVPYSLWDPFFIRNNILAIRDVWEGAYTGMQNIVIYDIRDLEVA